ncbi:MAG: DUF1326 domain-containing protein [Parvibaculaceae bacterium]
MAPTVPWHIRGELIISCNCDVFCPCVISLGAHPPTEGECQAWGGFRIDDGRHGDVDLSGIAVGLVLEIPGRMARGNWTAGVYVDEKADVYQVKALTQILSGRAGGTTKLLSILVGRFLGVFQEEVRYETEGHIRRFSIPKIVDGEIAAIRGREKDKPTTIENSQYWIGPLIIVAESVRSRFRGFGRNWDFKGKSAEIVPIDWRGP